MFPLLIPAGFKSPAVSLINIVIWTLACSHEMSKFSQKYVASLLVGALSVPCLSLKKKRKRKKDDALVLFCNVVLKTKKGSESSCL